MPPDYDAAVQHGRTFHWGRRVSRRGIYMAIRDLVREDIKTTIAVLSAFGAAAILPPAAAHAGQAPAGVAQSPSASAAKPFVPPAFSVPTLVEAKTFKLVPLGPDLVKIDFDAYMSSIDHLQQTFTRSTDWPHANISAADAMLDMQTEQARFQGRVSFAYAVLTPDGQRERGSVYVAPSTVPGYDAVVRMWVTKAEYDAGFDAELYAWVTDWVRQSWPFAKIAYPGRAIDWASWDAMVAKAKAEAGDAN